MEKAHEVTHASVGGAILRLEVDGKSYEVDVTRFSDRLAGATPEQRARFEVSPTGYGIHWPDIDEDLSIDGLIGARHSHPTR